MSESSAIQKLGMPKWGLSMTEGRLVDWLVEYARAEGCDELHLNSRVQRFDAHRFYLNKRMSIE